VPFSVVFADSESGAVLQSHLSSRRPNIGSDTVSVHGCFAEDA